MEELTQAQQFVVWYERICRDRDFAARYYDLADRTIRKEMGQRMIKLTDTEMLDWIEEHVFEIREGFADDEPMELRWIGRDGERHSSFGADLRNAIRKAIESEHVHKWEMGMDGGGTYVCECGAWK